MTSSYHPADLRMNWRLLGTRWTPGQADTLGPLMARAMTHALAEGPRAPTARAVPAPAASVRAARA